MAARTRICQVLGGVGKLRTLSIGLSINTRTLSSSVVNRNRYFTEKHEWVKVIENIGKFFPSNSPNLKILKLFCV